MMVPTGIFSVMSSPAAPNMSEPHAVLTALGLVPARIAVVHQGVEVGVCHGKHMTAAPAVAPVGPAELLVLFVPERDAAAPPSPAEMSMKASSTNFMVR
jgi:hypothetical protein